MIDLPPSPHSPNEPSIYLMNSFYEQRQNEDKKLIKERNTAIKDSIASAYLQCETSLSPFISHCLASQIGLVDNPNELSQTKSSKCVNTMKNKKKPTKLYPQDCFYNQQQQHALTPSPSEMNKSKSPMKFDFTQNNKSTLYIKDKLARMKNLLGGDGLSELSLCDITPKANISNNIEDQQNKSSQQHVHFLKNENSKESSQYKPRRNVIINCDNINISNINNALFYDDDQKKNLDCMQLNGRLRINQLNMKTIKNNDDKRNYNNNIRERSSTSNSNNSAQLRRSETFHETFYNSCQFIKQTQQQQQQILQQSKQKNIIKDSTMNVEKMESINLPRVHNENNSSSISSNGGSIMVKQFLCSGSSGGQEEQYSYPLYINRVNRVRGTQNYKGKRVKSCNINSRIPRNGWDVNGSAETKELDNKGNNKQDFIADPRQIYRENLYKQLILPCSANSPKKEYLQRSQQVGQIQENIVKGSGNNKTFLVNAVTNQLQFHV